MALQLTTTNQTTNVTTDISASVKWDTLAKTEVLTKEVDRLEFEITKTPAKTTLPDVNDAITVTEDGTKIFGGVIVERNEVIRGGLLVGYEFKCKDWSQYLDRKLVVKSYTNKRADEIFRDILSNFTSGFTSANVPSSGTPNLTSKKFNYEQVSRAFTQVCDTIGYDWYVDYNKDVHLFDEETVAAPFSLTDTNDTFEWATFELNKTILQIKNEVYVRGGDYKKTIPLASAVDVFVANGVQTTFFLSYKYDNIGVDDNGVTKTIGTDQQTDPLTVDTLYNFNEKFIRFTTAPTAGHTIKIYGDAYIPIIALVRDQISIGSYGSYQTAVIDQSITSVGEAQSRAKAELKKYSAVVNEATFKTTKTGLRTGMQIVVNSSVRGINKTFKINRITGKARTPNQMEYTVSLIASGQVTFTDIMVNLLTADKQNLEFANNEVLQRLETFLESLTVTDLVTPTKKTAPYTWGTFGANDLVWDFGTWA